MSVVNFLKIFCLTFVLKFKHSSSQVFEVNYYYMDIHEHCEFLQENKHLYTEEEYFTLYEEWLKDYKKYLLKDIPVNAKKYY